MTAARSIEQHLLAALGAGAAAPPEIVRRIATSLSTVVYGPVLAPPDADGVAAALSLCSAEGWPVLAAGSGTWLAPPGAGAIPPVVISTARLDQVIEHEPADLVVGVEAGMPLTALGERLAAHTQWLPLDPPAAPDSTIGAVAGLGASGPLRARHGTPRDMVLGIQVATGDGRLVRFGGRVVKNVAGYDGVRLLVGSRGRLGIITTLYLRVRGTPRADCTVALECGAGADGARCGAELALAVRDAVECDAVELISPRVAAHIGGGSRAGWRLVVRLLGGEAEVAEGLERVKGVGAATQAGKDGWSGLRDEVWSALADLEADAGEAVQLSGAPGRLAEGLDAVAGALEDHRSGSGLAGWYCAAHGTEGVIRLWRPQGAVSSGSPDILPPDGAWALRTDRLSGSTPPRPEAKEGVAGLTRRLRSVFDPAGILAGAAEVGD